MTYTQKKLNKNKNLGYVFNPKWDIFIIFTQVLGIGSFILFMLSM